MIILPGQVGVQRLHLNHCISHLSVISKVKPEASTSDIAADVAVLQKEQREYFFEGFTERWHSRWSAPSGITNCFQEMPANELKDNGLQEILDMNLTAQAHTEYLYESIAYPGGSSRFFTPLSNESYISMTASNLVAQSRGNITIGSGSMLDYPSINPNVSVHVHASIAMAG